MAKRFDKSLDKATDSTLLEPNWDAILDCVDQIRAGEVPAKHSVTSIRKKLLDENPHSIINALLVLDACVKNCGSKVHTEIATKEFMTEYRELVLHKSDTVRDKALEMLQCWAMAFVSQPAYKIIVDTHNLLKLSGFSFPPLKDPETMYIAQVAPEWVEGDNCFRCRAEFGIITRRHHCRACGQIFCGDCSSKVMPLPLLGIEKPVRVCDACHEKGPNAGRNTSPKEEAKAKQSNAEAEKKERELKEKEEEELQLALAMSQSEAEAKERERKMYSIYNGDAAGGGGGGAKYDDASSIAPSESLGYRGTAPSMAEPEVASDDPLAKYLNRDYWEKKTEESTIKKIEDWTISAPAGYVPPLSECGSRKDSMPSFSLPPTPSVMGEDQAAADTIQFCDQVKEQVTMMDSRIRSNVARGRSIINDSAILPLFERLTTWHGEVLARMAKLDEDRAHLETLQDHLAHIGEARQAMDALREEHGRRMREEEEERRRQKQAAMSYKLEMMRAKKHEMLMNQRHAALERFQQNEMMHRMGGYPPQGMPPQAGYPQQQQQQQQYGQPQYAPVPPPPQGMYQQQPVQQQQHYTGEPQPPQHPVHPQMIKNEHHSIGGGYRGMQQPQQAPPPAPVDQQQYYQQQHSMQQPPQYHQMPEDPSLNGAPAAAHSQAHLQYAPPPHQQQQHLPYTPAPAALPAQAPPPVQQQQEEQVLISFD